MSASRKIFFILNPSAGSGDWLDTFSQKVRRLPQSSVALIGKRHLEKTITEAWNSGYTTFAAAGGDGTVSAVASALLKLHLPAKLGIVPLGTYNHFARDIGIPASIYKSLDTIIRGKTALVDAVSVNGRHFINNSSLGLYPYIITERDAVKRRGLLKWVRGLAAFLKAYRRYPYVYIEFELKGTKFSRRTPFAFIGNNAYAIEAGRLGARRRLDQGVLSVLIARKVSRPRLIQLAWHALRGSLTEQRDFDKIGLSKLTIRSPKRNKLKVAYDGEVAHLVTPIRYAILPRALRVIIP